MEEQPRKSPFGMGWIGILVTLVSYFGFKYGIAAQIWGEEDLNIVYSILLVFACTFLGRAVEDAILARKKK